MPPKCPIGLLGTVVVHGLEQFALCLSDGFEEGLVNWGPIGEVGDGGEALSHLFSR